MGSKTGIEWTDSTWNPFIGCSRVSEGCRHCYAERIAARFPKSSVYGGLTQIVNGSAVWTGDLNHSHEDTRVLPLKWKKPRRVFVNSMSDLFHENAPDEWIDHAFAVMALSPQHTFQILTKRPRRMLEYFTNLGSRSLEVRSALIGGYFSRIAPERGPVYEWPGLPLPNVWLGVSVEHQEAANERIPLLLKTPSAVRFISAEPLLGPIDLTRLADVPGAWRDVVRGEWRCAGEKTVREKDARKLDWVIAGGESGPGARPMHPAWPRVLRDQCAAAGVPFFFKQWGDYPRGRPAGDGFVEAGWKPDHKGGAILDSLEWRQFPGQK